MALEKRQKVLLAVSIVLFLVALTMGCIHLVDCYVQKELEKLKIVLTGVTAEVKLPAQGLLVFTVELENANSAWVDLVETDYCVTINGTKIHCGKHPDGRGKAARVTAEDTAEIDVPVKPTPGNTLKLLKAVISKPGLPKARLEGTARIKSPLGELEYEYKTKPIEFKLKKIGLKVDFELPGLKKAKKKKKKKAGSPAKSKKPRFTPPIGL